MVDQSSPGSGIGSSMNDRNSSREKRDESNLTSSDVGTTPIGADIPYSSSASGEGFANRPHMEGSESARGMNSDRGEGAVASDYVGFAREYGSRVVGGVSQAVRDLPDRSRGLARDLDSSVHSNPWMHIGIFGAGALLLGYLFGRGMNRSEKGVLSTPMGRGYDDFDDAIDE